VEIERSAVSVLSVAMSIVRTVKSHSRDGVIIAHRNSKMLINDKVISFGSLSALIRLIWAFKET
jgi:hypothetical protein